MDNQLQDLRESLRRGQEDKLIERLRTDTIESDLADAQRQLHRPRYWLGRLYVVLSILTNMSVIYFEELSLGHRVLLRLAPAGWAVLYVIAALALLGVADVIVNDIMPPRFVLQFASRWRHLGYMALAVSLASLMFLITAVHGNTALNFILGLDMLMALSIGALTPFSRHRWGNT